MTTFLVRRLIQMFFVIIISALLTYVLLFLSPGGPIAALMAEQQRGGAQAISQADIVRVRERFELDLYALPRFTRWLIGHPRGPVTIGDQQYFTDVVVGCAVPGQVRLRYPDGRTEIIEDGCAQVVTLGNLEGRRVSNGILLGDFGQSLVMLRDRPVSTLIMSRLPYTLSLMGVSTLLAIIFGVLIGIYSAIRQNSFFDYIMTAFAFVGASLPSFFFGILMILVFAILFRNAGLPYLPPGNAVANRDYVVPLIGLVQARSFLDQFLHFIMPCAVLTFISLAGWSRFIRSSMLEVLHQDYVRTARAKGVKERVVTLKHALRNALIPFVTLLAGVLPTLFAGAIITEAVFNWPGLGRLFFDALGVNDYTVVMALLFVSIVLQLIGFLLSDILYTIVDPRIRLA